MRNVLGHHEATNEMLDGTCFAAVRSQYERVEALFPASVSKCKALSRFVIRNLRSKVVQHGHVGVGVVLVISIRRVFDVVPGFRRAHVFVEKRVLRLALIVHRVEAYHLQTQIQPQSCPGKMFGRDLHISGTCEARDASEGRW